MNCDEARFKLFDLVQEQDAGEVLLAAAERSQLLDHVAGCADCTADAAAIRQWREHAAAWVDAPVPRWRRPALARPTFWRDWRQWFPVAASATALALAAASLFHAQTDPLNTLPNETVAANSRALVQAELAQWRQAFEAQSAADRTRLIEAMMAANRAQREQELAALAATLKQEMDRRAFETEDSLRYLVTHQVQGERRLNDLVHFVGGLNSPQENRP